jgi:hypothetical protein
VLVASNHEDFATRFSNVQFPLVILEEQFAAKTLEENQSLHLVQHMPMAQRRHATILLLGHQFETLNAMQAFAKSVHAVINWADLGSLSQIIQQVVPDNNLFLNVYKETTQRSASGKA